MNFEKVETTLIIKYFPDLSRILSQKKRQKANKQETLMSPDDSQLKNQLSGLKLFC